METENVFTCDDSFSSEDGWDKSISHNLAVLSCPQLNIRFSGVKHNPESIPVWACVRVNNFL